MNFEKFKKIKPKNITPPVDSDSYSEKLLSLKSRPSNSRLLPILSTCAAAVIIITVVTVWALIGHGLRTGDVTIPPASGNQNEQSAPVLKKDESITDLHREQFFEMFAEYKINAMPSFDEGSQPLTNDMLWYIFQLNTDKTENGQLSSEIFENETRRLFGFDYGLGNDLMLNVGNGQLCEYPFAELIEYEVNGSVVTATAAVYYMWNLVEQNCEELYPEDFIIAKSSVITRNGNTIDISGIYTVKFESEDGITPTRFVELKKHLPPSTSFMEFFDYDDKQMLEAEYKYADTPHGIVIKSHTYDENIKNIVVPDTINGKPVIRIDTNAFYNHKATMSIRIPSSVIAIGKSAFYRCYSLSYFHVPKNVMSIGADAFFRASSLQTIKVDDDNENFTDIGGVLYNKDATTLLVYPEGNLNKEFVIPDSVTTIQSGAFGYYPRMERLVIPESVINFPDSPLFIYPDTVTLVVKKGSAAEDYAIKHSLKYELIN